MIGFAVAELWWNPLTWKIGPRMYQGEFSAEQWYHLGPVALMHEVDQ